MKWTYNLCVRQSDDSLQQPQMHLAFLKVRNNLSHLFRLSCILYNPESSVKKKKKKKDKRSIHSIPPQGDDSTKYERPERSDR